MNKLTLILCLILSAPSFSNTALDQINQIIEEREQSAQNVRLKRVTISHHTTPETGSSFIAKHELVFFYLSTCPHCHRLAPILEEYAREAGYLIRAYSIDGITLPQFPDSLPASRQILNDYFGDIRISVPALYLVNKKTRNGDLMFIGERSLSHLRETVAQFEIKIAQREAELGEQYV